MATTHERSRAHTIAEGIEKTLSGDCKMITIAGSVRRQKTYVKDVEIVAWPLDVMTFWGKVDGFIARGEAKQAVYAGDKKRWGDHYRGLMINGIKIEIFLADVDNWGFQLWLRTGPWDSNKEVMTAMSKRRWPVRFDKGYAWEVQYPEGSEGGDDYKKLSKLRVATEQDAFALMGMDYLYPTEREMYRYRRPLFSAKTPDPQLVARMRVDAPKPAKQLGLF